MLPENNKNHERFRIMYRGPDTSKAIVITKILRPMQNVKYFYNIKVLIHLDAATRTDIQ